MDNVGASTTVTTDLTVQGYAAPSVGGFTTSGGSTRELGNVASTVTGTIYRNSPNINLVSYQIEYQLNGTGAWTAIGTPTNITAGVSSVDFSVNHASSAGTLNATSISYRVKVADAYVSVTYLGEGDNVVYFYIKRILGFSSNTSLTVAQINAITNLADVSFTNNVYADISNVTSGGANYTYYCYSSSATDITNITLDGSAPVTTSFVKQVPDVTGTNSYGATVTYKVYKSDAKGAYTNNRLTIS